MLYRSEQHQNTTENVAWKERFKSGVTSLEIWISRALRSLLTLIEMTIYARSGGLLRGSMLQRCSFVSKTQRSNYTPTANRVPYALPKHMRFFKLAREQPLVSCPTPTTSRPLP